jgi:fluoride ion exporter CrcB/FEX
MNSITKIARWPFLFIGIALFFIYLNHAMARAWLSYGPPTENPEGWLFSAGNFLSWSLASLCAGVGLFILLGKLPSISKVAIALIIFAGILGIFPTIRTFVATDRCLDAGGKWSPLELRCQYK